MFGHDYTAVKCFRRRHSPYGHDYDPASGQCHPEQFVHLTRWKCCGDAVWVQIAVCNELFGALDFGRSCDLSAEAGFDGIEIAPFTVASRSGVPSSETARSIRRSLAESGLRFAGLHWLLARPDGLNVTTADASLRRRSWAHVEALLQFAGELGGGNLILGSPKQRSFASGSRGEAVERFVEGIIAVSDVAVETGCRILIEALPARVTNFVNTIAEARRVAELAGHPAVGIMFDFHNVDDESESAPALIRRHGAALGHVHLNTNDGGAPTPDDAPAFAPAFEALRETDYRGWVSLEIFTEPAQPSAVLAGVRDFLQAVEVPSATQ